MALAQRAKQAVDWNKVASFYAGHPVTIDWRTAASMGGYQGKHDPNNPWVIGFGPPVKNSLANWQNPSAGVMGLTSLLHEALRNRGELPADGSNFQDKLRKQDYWTVQAGSVSLLPDLMQRFLGIKFDSPLGQSYYKAAKALFPGGLGPPQKNYQDMVSDHNWTSWLSPTHP